MDEHEHRWRYSPIVRTCPERHERRCICGLKELRFGPTWAMLEDRQMHIIKPATRWTEATEVG